MHREQAELLAEDAERTGEAQPVSPHVCVGERLCLLVLEPVEGAHRPPAPGRLVAEMAFERLRVRIELLAPPHGHLRQARAALLP